MGLVSVNSQRNLTFAQAFPNRIVDDGIQAQTRNARIKLNAFAVRSKFSRANGALAQMA
jgi:hypothetical protein